MSLTTLRAEITEAHAAIAAANALPVRQRRAEQARLVRAIEAAQRRMAVLRLSEAA